MKRHRPRTVRITIEVTEENAAELIGIAQKLQPSLLKSEIIIASIAAVSPIKHKKP